MTRTMTVPAPPSYREWLGLEIERRPVLEKLGVVEIDYIEDDDLYMIRVLVMHYRAFGGGADEALEKELAEFLPPGFVYMLV